MNGKRILCISVSVVFCSLLMAQQWPSITTEMKPGTRWWWLGSAVDKENITWNIKEYANKGLGTLEITPIYGVQGNEANELKFLSPQWMEALRYCEENGKKNNVDIDMNTGTGWPFGGPEVPIDEAACKVVFCDTTINGKKIDVALNVAEKEKKFAQLHKVMAYGNKQCIDVTSYVNNSVLKWKAPKKGSWRIIALYISRTGQKVKRAAPGGEGFVIDHFDKDAVKHYLEKFDRAFQQTGVPYPKTFFNDSYEVYGADWTPSLLDEFVRRRGYRLENNLDKLIDRDSQVLSDYRETLGELLLENFTMQWTEWAHSHGSRTRNQAHGSPANLIDVYAAVDIPEIEGFGLSDFNIKGLRKDSGYTKKNDSDISMLKYAASAAHITGKQLVSSETFTWLTEHFRTSLSQMKPDMDLMFTCGVNHMFFHGTCYSPKDEEWPGWRFYASVDMSPNNTIWRDAKGLTDYITRCQSFLQAGKPDNDILVYLPVRDMWKRAAKNNQLLMMFDIHSMAEKAPDFIRDVMEIDSLGYDCDYISDKYLLSTSFEDGMLKTIGGTKYKAIVIPGSGNLPEKVRKHLDDLATKGAVIINGIDSKALASVAKAEEMRLHGLRAIRRDNGNGYTYFIANLTPNDFNEFVGLSVDYEDALFFNPMNGEIRKPYLSDNGIMLSLRSGESVILRTYNHKTAYRKQYTDTIADRYTEKVLDGKWQLSFVESTPAIGTTYNLDKLTTWENINDTLSTLMGTGVYTTYVNLSKQEAQKRWKIDLGDVRESARVYVNGEYIGCAWAVPYIIECNPLRTGRNEIRIEVTNLPANHIAELDRQGVKWRKFKEINVVNIKYKKDSYANWSPVPSGLNSDVKLFCE